MKLRVNVNNVNYDVDVEILDDGQGGQVAPRPVASVAAARPAAAPAASAAPVAASANALPSPIPGTVLEIKVEAGAEVKSGDVLMIVDAMKMNTPIASPRDGKIKAILVKIGDAVKMGQPLLDFE